MEENIGFYKLSMTGKEADSGIRAGMEVGATNGILFGDGNGGVRAATPGTDYGYPLLTGNGPPTANTAANLGQHYFDMAATKPPYEYICVGYNAQGFVWLVFGDTGNGFKILGYFASLDALEAAITDGIVPAPSAGVAYGIGTAAPYDIYVWDGVNNAWINNGSLGSSGGGEGVPPHGNTGQALIKFSDEDYDAGWGPVSDIAPGAVGAVQLAAGSVQNSALAESSVGTANVQNASIIRDKLANDAKILSFVNVVVNPGAWTEDNTYEDFGYRAAIDLAAVTTNHFALVVFSARDAVSGTFAPVAETYEGGVFIYADAIPEANIVVPSIICTPVA